MKNYKCRLCGFDYTPERTNQIYCSRGCQNKDWEVKFTKIHGMSRAKWRYLKNPEYRHKVRMLYLNWVSKNSDRAKLLGERWRRSHGIPPRVSPIK